MDATACTSPRATAGQNGRLSQADETAMEFSQFLQAAENKMLKLVPRKRGPGRSLQSTAQSLFDRFLQEHGDTVNPKRTCTSRRSIDSQTSTSTASTSVGQQMSRREFLHCMSVMRSWYQRLPILNARAAQPNVSLENDASPIIAGPKPIIYEVPEGLDIKFGLGVLANVLKCPLCQGLFCNAHTVKECMHTFCKSCIVLSTLQYGLVCPKCSAPLSAHVLEAIEYDHNIQGLVDKLFPHFHEQESEAKETLCKLLGQDHLYGSEDVKTSCNNKAVFADATTRVPGEGLQLVSDDDYSNGDGNGDGRGGERLRDVTMPFLDLLVLNRKSTLWTINTNVACLALLHECDVADLGEMFKHVEAYVAPGDLMAKKLKTTRAKGVFQRRFLCVPKTTFIYEIIKFMMHSFNLRASVKIAILLDNCPLPRNHSIEFICKSRRIDLQKCILLRYKTFN